MALKTVNFSKSLAAKANLGGTLWGPSGAHYNIRSALESGRVIRDSALWQLPILPEAAIVYQDLASSREWVVSGKPRSVSRAVEWINNAKVLDFNTGLIEYGYESFLRRRALDHICVGRTSFVIDSTKTRGSNLPELEYVDPTYLTWQVKDSRQPLQPSQKTWQYWNNRNLRYKDVFVNHAVPLGVGGFVAPISTVLPTARLAWLVREHNVASVDGRKLREIILVSGVNVEEELEEALDMVVAMYAGAKPEEIGGIPVLEIQTQPGEKVQDRIGKLGISEIPENFNEEEFIFQYVNEIAAALGLALRHFWNNERTTNRALEVVQEQRQQQKGPSVFVRTEQRMMNREGGPMDLFSQGANRTRFGFVEEVDSSSRKENADVLFLTTQALEKVATTFGAGIDLHAYLAWMQAIGVLPNELTLVDSDVEMTMVNPDQQNFNNEGEETQGSETAPIPLANNNNGKKGLPTIPEYDEVMMNSKGEIVDRRRKIFTVERVIASELLKKVDQFVAEDIDMNPEDVFVRSVMEGQLNNQREFRQKYGDRSDQIADWLKNQSLFDGVLAQEAIQKCLANVHVERDEAAVIDELIARWGDG